MLGCSMCTLPFSTLCDDMLAMLVCTTRWLSMHLYTLVYMFMHESCLLVCRPCFNTLQLWTFDPNLHLSLINTTFCFPSCFVCLFICFFVCLPDFLFVCASCLSYLLPHAMLAMSIMFICFMPLSYALYFFSFHCLSVGFLSLPLHVRTWSKDAWSQGAISQAQAKKARMRACRCGSSDYSQQVQGLAFSLLVMYSFKPHQFSSLSPLDGLYQVYHALYLSSSFWAILQGCRHLLSCSVCQHCA